MGMGLTYPPPTFVFFFFLFSFRLSDTSLLGAIAREASKNSIKFAGIWRKSLFLILIIGQIYSGIKKLMFAYHEKKPNVLYHRIWAVIAFLLNNPLTGCSRQQQSFIWKQVVVDSSNPFSPLYGNRL